MLGTPTPRSRGTTEQGRTLTAAATIGKRSLNGSLLEMSRQMQSTCRAPAGWELSPWRVSRVTRMEQLHPCSGMLAGLLGKPAEGISGSWGPPLQQRHERPVEAGMCSLQ